MVRDIPASRLKHRLITLSSGIPTKPGGGNHTKHFTQSARTEEAHEATMLVTKALALTCVKVIMDDGLFKEVRVSTATDRDRFCITFCCRSRRLSVGGDRELPCVIRFCKIDCTAPKNQSLTAEKNIFDNWERGDVIEKKGRNMYT